jgi:hypothetical protein
MCSDMSQATTRGKCPDPGWRKKATNQAVQAFGQESTPRLTCVTFSLLMSIQNLAAAELGLFARLFMGYKIHAQLSLTDIPLET